MAANRAFAGVLPVFSGNPLLNLVNLIVEDGAADVAGMPMAVRAVFVSLIFMGSGLSITACLASTEVSGIGRVLCVLFPLREIVLLMLCFCATHGADLPVPGLRVLKLFAVHMFLSYDKTAHGTLAGMFPVIG